MCMDYPHRFLLEICRYHLNNMTLTLIFIGESICNKNPPNLKVIDTQFFLMDLCSICHVNYHTQSLLLSDLGKWVISKMASKMAARILQ